MPSEIYPKPRYFFNVSLPLVREVRPQWWFRLRRLRIGYFGCSPATNLTVRVVFFGWTLCEWKKHEWHDRTDAERADEYLREWSKCERELQMFRRARLGEDCAPEVKQLIKDSLGVDLDEGTVR